MAFIQSLTSYFSKKINAFAAYPNRWGIVLFCILLGHLVIKLVSLPYMEVKGDESYSIFHAQQTFGELMITFQEEANPPLFFILLRGWISIFGISLFAVKSFIVLISIGTAIFIFLLGKQTGSLLMTVFASICFLFSNLHFDYSHEIRAFELVLFLSVGSMYVFLAYVKAPFEGNMAKHLKAHWLTFLTIFIFTLSLVYSHYNAVFVPFIQLLISVALARKQFYKMALLWFTWLLAAIAFIPQLAIFKNIIPNEHFWLGLATIKDLKYIHLKLVGNDALFFVLLIPFYLSPLIALFMKRRGWLKKQFSWTVFFVFWLLFPVPILLNFWVAQYIPSFQIRYLLFSSLGIYLSLGYIFGMFERFKFFAKGFLLLTSLHFIYSFSPQNRDSEGWKETAEMVRNFKKQNVLVLINASYKAKDLMYYYDPTVFSNYKDFENQCRKSMIFPVIDGKDVLQLKNLNAYKKVILVLNHHANQDPNGTVLSELDKRFNLCYEIGDGIGAKIRVYSARSEQCTDLKYIYKKTLSSEKTGKWEYQWMYEAISSTRVDAYNFQSITKEGIKVDAEIAYSPLRKTFAETVSLVDVNLKYRASEVPNSVLIVSVEKGPISFKRAEYPLANYYQNGSGQISIKSSVMGSYPKGAMVKSYVWNPGGPTVFLDSLNIAFWRK